MLIALVAGCVPKKVPIVPVEAQPPVTQAPPPPVPEPAAPTVDIGTDYAALSPLEDVHFEFNQADLRRIGEISCRCCRFASESSRNPSRVVLLQLLIRDGYVNYSDFFDFFVCETDFKPRS
jgi:hypothetical protein